MARPATIKSLGQYNVLVFQNEGAETLAAFLQERCYCATATDEDNVLSDIAVGDVDLIIVDYYKKYNKDRDLTVVNYARRYRPNMPVLLCIEDDDPKAVVTAYEAGAYDVIRKPYNIEELACKLKVWSAYIPLKYIDLKDECRIHNFVFNAKDHTFFNGTNTIMLTDKENAVMAYLFSCPNQLVMTSIILNAIWHQSDAFAKRSLDFYISSIRKYIKPDPSVQLITVFGKGYVLRVENPK